MNIYDSSNCATFIELMQLGRLAVINKYISGCPPLSEVTRHVYAILLLLKPTAQYKLCVALIFLLRNSHVNALKIFRSQWDFASHTAYSLDHFTKASLFSLKQFAARRTTLITNAHKLRTASYSFSNKASCKHNICNTHMKVYIVYIYIYILHHQMYLRTSLSPVTKQYYVNITLPTLFKVCQYAAHVNPILPYKITIF